MASNLLAMASNPTNGLQPSCEVSNLGLQPTRNGLQPTSDGLQPTY